MNCKFKIANRHVITQSFDIKEEWMNVYVDFLDCLSSKDIKIYSCKIGLIEGARPSCYLGGKVYFDSGLSFEFDIRQFKILGLNDNIFMDFVSDNLEELISSLKQININS